ncbi:AAA family ATPase [Sporocytophaga myxococcoides]|uniref:AAA family ATPase n=1 Tax=Sporocytophaga myxococcoides TaxID=153721 RepID=UPI000403CF7A|nr:AAA family ATPase [Sporocytophaga myxococcoides]
MEAVIFCGIQASGKSTFFKDKFFKTHVRISMDLLRTRNRERLFLETCLKTQQPFVVENTNPTRVDREKYISMARERDYKVIGYYFKTNLKDALERNSCRDGKECVPEVGIKATLKKFELPSLDEGFDKLYCVEIINGEFILKDWSDEV